MTEIVKVKTTRELVNDVADELYAQGQNPTVDRILAIIKRGSRTTINDQLRIWKEKKEKENVQQRGNFHLPDFLVEANRAILEQAELAASEKFSEERKGYLLEIEQMNDSNEKLESLNLELMAEIARLRAIEATITASLMNSNEEVVRLTEKVSSQDRTNESLRIELEAKSKQLELKSSEFAETIQQANARLRESEHSMFMEIDKARLSEKAVVSQAMSKVTELQETIDELNKREKEKTDSLQLLVNQLQEDRGLLAGLLESQKTVAIKRRRSLIRKASFRRYARHTKGVR